MSEICAMQVLVVSATEMEITSFISRKTGHDYLITGVGIPACMYSLTSHLQNKKYDLVIQAGIAGTFTNELALGETVLVQRDLFADAGAFESNDFLSLHELGLLNNNQFPYTNGWLVNDHNFMRSASIAIVNAITVGMVSDDHLPLNNLFKSKYAPAIESMEGAALHYVCLQKHIPFLQLRSISNIVGERDKAKWKMKDAIDNLDDSLEKLLSEVAEN